MHIHASYKTNFPCYFIQVVLDRSAQSTFCCPFISGGDRYDDSITSLSRCKYSSRGRFRSLNGPIFIRGHSVFVRVTYLYTKSLQWYSYWLLLQGQQQKSASRQKSLSLTDIVGKLDVWPLFLCEYYIRPRTLDNGEDLEWKTWLETWISITRIKWIILIGLIVKCFSKRVSII